MKKEVSPSTAVVCCKDCVVFQSWLRISRRLNNKESIPTRTALVFGCGARGRLYIGCQRLSRKGIALAWVLLGSWVMACARDHSMVKSFFNRGRGHSRLSSKYVCGREMKICEEEENGLRHPSSYSALKIRELRIPVRQSTTYRAPQISSFTVHSSQKRDRIG